LIVPALDKADIPNKEHSKPHPMITLHTDYSMGMHT